MVISFSVPEARNQLLNRGFVYTFRWHERKKRLEETWANTGRGTKKISDVLVEHIKTIIPHPINLNPYTEHSGFESKEAWSEKIMNMKPRNSPKYGYLYRVIVYPKR